MVVTTTAVLSLTMMMPEIMGRWALAACSVVLALAIWQRAAYAIHLALLGWLWVLLLGLAPSIRVWPLTLLAPLAGYSLVLAMSPRLRRSVGWLRSGQLSWVVWRYIALATAASSAALAAWVIFLEPDLNHHLALVPSMYIWAYPLAAIAFAAINAAMEEAVFRGIMMEALDSALGENLWSLGTQAVAFAAFHYLAGFPSGVIGFVMVLIYGFMLGFLRRRSGGMVAPWVTHVAADLVIFAILAIMLLG